MEVYGKKPKFGTKEWFTNYFWYHYKWATLGVVFLLFLIGMFIKDIVTREKYDMEVSVNSALYISQEQEQRMREVFNSFAYDFDGDGVVNVGLFANNIPDGEQADPQMVMAGQTKFVVELSEGNSMILIMDDATYRRIGDPDTGNEDFFEDLSAYSDKAYDSGTKIRLSDTPLGEDPLLAPIADQLFLTMRSHDSHLVTKDETAMQRYDEQKQVLENLLNNQKTTE